jgi:uncharacterized protein YdiU (UPF0061 family)
MDRGEDSAKEALAAYAPRFEVSYLGGLRRKIGLLTEQEGDDTLAQDLLRLMVASGADFTLTFRRLSAAVEQTADDETVRTLLKNSDAYDAWAVRWRARLAAEAAPATTMRASNPAFIPRNHLVETALAAAVEHADFAPFEKLMDILSRPYDDNPALEHYTLPARDEERVSQTFCGT